MSTEFELIARYFSRPTAHTDLAGGDDAALFSLREGMQCAVSTDSLISGIHFLPDVDPHSLGWKAAAVNISDMAAMGALPRWMTLALSLPEVNAKWVEALAAGFARCCETFNVDWVGGDTTRGPLALTPTIMGEIPRGQAVLRSGAQVGDDVWVSGSLGLAALGLQFLQRKISLSPLWQNRCVTALQEPQPRVALGQTLRGIAHAMLDISDGLVGDLAHIAKASNVRIILPLTDLPYEDALAASKNNMRIAQQAYLAGGDDYELAFCVSQQMRDQISEIAQVHMCALRRVGYVEAGPLGVFLQNEAGVQSPPNVVGFDHFVARQ